MNLTHYVRLVCIVHEADGLAKVTEAMGARGHVAVAEVHAPSVVLVVSQRRPVAAFAASNRHPVGEQNHAIHASTVGIDGGMSDAGVTGAVDGAAAGAGVEDVLPLIRTKRTPTGANACLYIEVVAPVHEVTGVIIV